MVRCSPFRSARSGSQVRPFSISVYTAGSHPSCAGARPCSVLAASSSSPPGPGGALGELVDLPAAVLACAEDAGLIPYERNVALLTGLRGDSLVPRVSFFQLEHVRKARAAGTPHLAIAHEDILVLRNPI